MTRESILGRVKSAGWTPAAQATEGSGRERERELIQIQLTFF